LASFFGAADERIAAEKTIVTVPPNTKSGNPTETMYRTANSYRRRPCSATVARPSTLERTRKPLGNRASGEKLKSQPPCPTFHYGLNVRKLPILLNPPKIRPYPR
jgi:hypothetical protein